MVSIRTAVYFAAIAVILIQPLWAEEILLSSQQPYSLSKNATLVVEDVNPKSGVVWLKLYSQNHTISSALLGLGGCLNYSNTSLMVSRIYAGGNKDLVALDLGNIGKTNTTNNSTSGNSSEKAPVRQASADRSTVYDTAEISILTILGRMFTRLTMI